METKRQQRKIQNFSFYDSKKISPSIGLILFGEKKLLLFFLRATETHRYTLWGGGREQSFLCQRGWYAYRSWKSSMSQPPGTQFYGKKEKLDSKLCFYENVRRGNFLFGHSILTEGVFVTQRSCDAGISVWQTTRMCVTTDCCFVSDI